MDKLRQSKIRVVMQSVAFAALATALNWSELENIQRVLYPLWIFGIYLPNFD